MRNNVGQTKLCDNPPPSSTTITHHPPPAKIYPLPPTSIHHHPPLLTTSQNIPTTIQHHPQKAKIYPPPSTTIHRKPKYIHHHQPQSKIYPSKKRFYQKNIKIFIQKQMMKNILINQLVTHYVSIFQSFFYKKPIYKNLQPLPNGSVRNLTSRPAIAKKLFSTWPSPLFLRNG